MIGLQIIGVQSMRNITGKTLIFYTFQSNSKSSEYNVTTFKKSAPQQPKIRDVLYELPIDYQDHSFHFRFKSQFFEADEKIIGWIDISNLLAKVPILNNNIYVKILQLPSDRSNKLFNKQKLKAIGLLDPKGNSPSKQNHASNSEPKSQKVPTTGTGANISHAQAKVATNSSSFIDLHQSPINSSNIRQPQQNPSSSGVAGTQSPPKKTDEKPASVGKPYVPGSETPEQRLKAFQQQMKKEEQQKQQQQKAIKFHQEKLTQWGYSGHKTINNLTTLLATLHLIWPEWQPVSLSDMLKPEDVNSLYKKAVIKLHPDKNHNKDYLTKYLSKRIFELLNEAKKAKN